MLEKLRLRQFCCCCTVRTGSLVIGTLGWITTLVQTLTITSSVKSNPPVSDVEDYVEEDSNSTTIVLSVLSLFMSIALVWGIYQSDRKFILPWLVVKFLECAILTLVTLILFFAMFVTEAGGFFLLIFLIVASITAFTWYCWLCVWSLYQDLGEIVQTIIPTSMPMGQPMPMGQQMPNQYGQAIPMTQTMPMTDEKYYIGNNTAVAQEMV